MYELWPQPGDEVDGEMRYLKAYSFAAWQVPNTLYLPIVLRGRAIKETVISRSQISRSQISQLLMVTN